MEKLLEAILMIGAINGSNQDQTVARQGTANFLFESHCTSLAFARDFVEPSMMESAASQGLMGMWSGK